MCRFFRLRRSSEPGGATPTASPPSSPHGGLSVAEIAPISRPPAEIFPGAPGVPLDFGDGPPRGTTPPTDLLLLPSPSPLFAGSVAAILSLPALLRGEVGSLGLILFPCEISLGGSITVVAADGTQLLPLDGGTSFTPLGALVLEFGFVSVWLLSFSFVVPVLVLGCLSLGLEATAAATAFEAGGGGIFGSGGGRTMIGDLALRSWLLKT